VPVRVEQLFIVGMNGSGTTMLLDHLSSHSQLFGFPGETKFLPYFLRSQSRYGDLGDDQKFRRLWRDMSESFIGRVGSGPERIPLPEDWQEGSRTAAAVFDRIMRQFAAVHGKRTWCEKSPMYVHHLVLLAREFPNAKFIHIIRDGRGCAASFHRRWQFNPVRTAYRWKQAIRAGRQQGRLVGQRYYEVRYEELTGEPEPTLARICAFLGVPFELSVLTSARSRPEMTGTDATRIARNERMATSYFSPSQLARIERVAGKCLTELGYECRNASGDSDPSALALGWWSLSDDLRRLKFILLTERRLFRPGNWDYVVRRVRGSLKQRASLKR
jgi:hypothetical protein